jgi:hypothetical protein
LGAGGWRIVYFAKDKSDDQNVTMLHCVGNLPPYQFARDTLPKEKAAPELHEIYEAMTRTPRPVPRWVRYGETILLRNCAKQDCMDSITIS